MRSKTDIPGMDRPIGEYVEHWRRRQALEGKRNRRQARHDAERIAAMLRKKFGATRIVLFGSLVAERFSANSDIDLAVDGLAPADYFLALVEAGKLPVDLKPLGELFPHVRNRVLATGEETMRAMSPKRLRGVADDSSTELERLQRLSEDIAFVPAEIARDPGHARLFYENLALTLHNFYTGCERIFQTVAAELNGAPPGDALSESKRGFDWHRRLLERMSVAWGDRPAVLSGDSLMICANCWRFATM